MARSCSHPLILCLGYKAVTRDYCSRETLPLPGCGTKPEHDGPVSSSYLHEGPVVSATPQSCLWDQRRLALNQALILTQPLPDLPCFLLSLSLSQELPRSSFNPKFPTLGCALGEPAQEQPKQYMKMCLGRVTHYPSSHGAFRLLLLKLGLF